MRSQVMRITGAVIAIVAMTLLFAGCKTIGLGTKPPSIVVSPNLVQYKVTKTIKVSGSGFSPGSIVTIGVEGLGKWKKDAPTAKDLWFGLARVNEDRTFSATVSLRGNLWRVKGLSGEYSVVANDDKGKRATAPLIIKPKKK